MSLWEHLKELKNRLIKSAIGVVIGGIGGWILYDPLLKALAEPVNRISSETGGLAAINFGTIASPFDFKLQMSLLIGAVISSPIWIYQLWAFITPGLTSKERRYTLGYMAAAIPLFLAGIWVGWLVVPQVVHALTQFTPEGSSSVIDARTYIEFVTRMVLMLGLAFLVPVVLVGINMAGIVSGRTILKAWRITVFLVFVLAAIAAPGADAISMFMLAGPLLALFFAAIGICIMNDKRRERRQARQVEETEATADIATPGSELKKL
ncbi:MULTISPECIES: twin-arginine translocase subunit TatC [Micrococcaceae]|uniref:Sec-independent protein translocase protein TatC n=1 Tax=Pseudarthrobacter defluvii TaxID=410837 RepID=A0ABT9UH36_9MICC|nr:MULTISPECIES: twin-arginine translocase subunit TatC [Micrococcaceae]MDE8586376.1 twin-arginine translocase subunit TatC [Arthrobacter sp. NQ4]MDQ0118953.1 sec-independent protein translocase protein TatC [Pseudarthrobacter defluvii]UTT67850.1 twin-arginine translocase subunit TatC [Arthrobacter sp. DNA4]WRT16013.1 twin-arginine translocase subunit TatC [Pseudarthrobacter sp. LT1]